MTQCAQRQNPVMRSICSRPGKSKGILYFPFNVLNTYPNMHEPYIPLVNIYPIKICINHIPKTWGWPCLLDGILFLALVIPQHICYNAQSISQYPLMLSGLEGLLPSRESSTKTSWLCSNLDLILSRVQCSNLPHRSSLQEVNNFDSRTLLGRPRATTHNQFCDESILKC